MKRARQQKFRIKPDPNMFGRYTATLKTLADLYGMAHSILFASDAGAAWAYMLRAANEWRRDAAHRAGIR